MQQLLTRIAGETQMHHRDARSQRGASVTAAFAAKPKTDPPCSIRPSPAAVGETYVVGVSGLPTGVPINLWITDPSGSTSGYPLASAGDGSFALGESASSAGSRKYSFSGPTKNNPSATVVYSSCSVDAY